MDAVYSADSETDLEAESGLLSEDDAGSSSDPEVAELTKRLRIDTEGKKKGRLFSFFPTANASDSDAAPGRQMYKVYWWRWLMLVTLFLLNVSNGTVSEPQFTFWLH